MTLAIATAAWKPLVSLGFTAALLAGQLRLRHSRRWHSNHWAIYLGLVCRSGLHPMDGPAKDCGTSLRPPTWSFAAAMTFLMLSWRYGNGVGWFPPLYAGDRWMFQAYGWQLFSLLLVIAAACAAVGLLLALYQERGSLFRARTMAQTSLREAEVDLIVEQERTRIGRDLHDVLAHSLAVIAAQADGTRYLSKDQPRAVLNALENIADVGPQRPGGRAARHRGGARRRHGHAPAPAQRRPGPRRRHAAGSLKIQQSESGTPASSPPGSSSPYSGSSRNA